MYILIESMILLIKKNVKIYSISKQKFNLHFTYFYYKYFPILLLHIYVLYLCVTFVGGQITTFTRVL